MFKHISTGLTVCTLLAACGGSQKTESNEMSEAQRAAAAEAQTQAAHAEALNKAQMEQAQRHADAMQTQAATTSGSEVASKTQNAAQSANTMADDEQFYKTMQKAIYKKGFIARDARGIVLTIPNSELFRKDESVLSPQGKNLVVSLAKELKDAHKSLAIRGNTDAMKSSTSNDELSLAQAQTVRNELVNQGVRTEYARAEGLGASRPLDSSTTEEGRMRNRRVEIIITPAP